MSKKKTKVVKVIAGVMVAIMAAGGATWYALQSLFKKETASNNPYSVTSTDLSDLGKELTNKGNTKKETEKDKNNGYVEKNDKLYVDEESAKNADKVGTSKVDTQNGKLTVDSDGKVKEKDKGFEIKDQPGNVIESGNENSDGTIDGYEKNEELGGVFEKEDITSDVVVADSNYYDQDGNLIISKGEFLEKSSLEWAKQNLSTTKPTKKQEETQATSSAKEETKTPTSSKEETQTTTSASSTQEQGVINPDGTYTIYGQTYVNKDTFYAIASSDLDEIDIYIDSNGNINLKTNEKQKVR